MTVTSRYARLAVMLGAPRPASSDRDLLTQIVIRLLTLETINTYH